MTCIVNIFIVGFSSHRLWICFQTHSLAGIKEESKYFVYGKKTWEKSPKEIFLEDLNPLGICKRAYIEQQHKECMFMVAMVTISQGEQNVWSI